MNGVKWFGHFLLILPAVWILACGLVGYMSERWHLVDLLALGAAALIAHAVVQLIWAIEGPEAR